jgi:hypothetical protein
MDATALVRAGDTVVVSGIASLIAAEAALKAPREYFRETGTSYDNGRG